MRTLHAKAKKAGENKFFADSAKKSTTSEARKTTQKNVDKAILDNIKASKEPLLRKYLGARFSLANNDKAHELRFWRGLPDNLWIGSTFWERRLGARCEDTVSGVNNQPCQTTAQSSLNKQAHITSLRIHRFSKNLQLFTSMISFFSNIYKYYNVYYLAFQYFIIY